MRVERADGLSGHIPGNWEISGSRKRPFVRHRMNPVIEKNNSGRFIGRSTKGKADVIEMWEATVGEFDIGIGLMGDGSGREKGGQ